jgi:thiol-disulfide isomerase/thioredoxin
MPNQESTSPSSHRPAPSLVLFLILPVAGLLIALGILLAEENNKNNTAESNLQIGLSNTTTNYPASEFELPSMDGGMVKLSDYRGRFVYLNFWATWCGPCIEELPELRSFAQQENEKENGAVVLAVNSFDTPEEIERFLDENEIDLTGIPVLLDSRSLAFRQYGVGGMPMTYIIDANGMVTGVKIGGFASVEELYTFMPQ